MPDEFRGRKHRAYVFTRNNPDETPEVYAQKLKELEPRYFCFGVEKAPTTGTVHYQGYVVWRSGISNQVAIRRLRGCHVESAKGDSLQNREYCSKNGEETDGDHISFIEWGDRPLTGITIY